MKKVYQYIVVGLLASFALIGCQREELPPVTAIMVDSLVITPGYVDAEIVCRFRSNVSITHAMLYLSKDSSFSDVEEVVLSQQSAEVFTGTLTNLIDGMTYYVRYRVSNIWSKVILDETVEFTTYPISAPVMGDTKISDITFNSAIINGTMIRNGGKTISSRGVVYGVAANPTIENATKIVITDPGASHTCFLGGLEKNTLYYARPFAENELGVSYGQEVCFEVDTLWNGYNLGLSVNWAHVNIGAVSPEDAGDYFAWGEIAPKTEYNWRYYLHCYQGDPQQITKYAPYVDNLSTLEPEDDAATMNWGENWRMPTESEWNELREKCEWRWVMVNNVKGYQVTNLATSVSIFIPAAGKKDGITLLNQNEVGYYWTKWLDRKHEAKSYIMDDYTYGRARETRCYGLSVRAVCPR